MTGHHGGARLRLATFLAPNLLPVYRLLTDRIGRRLGRPVYFSDVIVHHNSPIGCLEELRGCSWAYNEPASHSGHTVTLYSLVRMGAQPGFFARVVEAGYHQRAIRLVASGVVDAAAIDSQVLTVELRDHPSWPTASDDIRAMLATIQAAGWTSLTQTTIGR